MSGKTKQIYSGVISLDKADGIYRCGDTATCWVTLTKNGRPLKGVTARMIRKWEAQVVETRDFKTTGKPVEFSCAGIKPGWLYFGFEVLGKDGEPLKGEGVYKHPRKPTIVTEIGAMFDPDKIVSPVREPKDFDAFWAKYRAEVSAAPLKPELTELKNGPKGIKLFAVKLPVVRGIMASGYLAYPENAKLKSLPGHIFFQSHTHNDVPRHCATGPALDGALAFACSWHGFPVNKRKEYYGPTITQYSKEHPLDFDNMENWSNTEIFLRVMRELDFIKSFPLWDGKNLVSSGGSLGGIQSTFATAIDPDVTLSVISVPSSCECNAYEAGRTPYGAFRKIGIDVLKAHPEYAEKGFYYDAINFAKRIKCETYVCTGFIDESCYPSNVYALFNSIPAGTPKTMSSNPCTGHFWTTKNVGGDERVRKLFGTVTISPQPQD